MAQAVAAQGKEKELVFEKVDFDPLSNPEAFGFQELQEADAPTSAPTSISPVDVDSGWDSEEKKESSKTTQNQPATNTNTSTAAADSMNVDGADDEMRGDAEEQNVNDEPDYDLIEAKLQRSKKKKKVDFRAEMTSDSQDIDDLLMFQSKERNELQEISKIDEELLLCLTAHSFSLSLTPILAQYECDIIAISEMTTC